MESDKFLAGFSFQFMNDHKTYSLMFDVNEMKENKENGSDYLQQIFNKLVHEHPELEQSIENFWKET